MAAKGKYAEGKIRAFLEMWKGKIAGFTFNRILDAHSSKGAMSNPQPGDFQWFHDSGVRANVAGFAHPFKLTRNGLIEAKEVEHDFRLPYKNFGIDQVGRMLIRQMAGSEAIVIVCHRKPEERGAMWRQVPLDFFRERPGPTFGSWDLSHFPATANLNEILEAYLK